MTRKRFEQLVEQVLPTIPRRFREAMRNMAIVVEDEPSPELREEMELEPSDTLLGLYQGTPLLEREWGYGNTIPDRITIFQRPIEQATEHDDDIMVTVGETVIHELGHYFGLSEEELESIEAQYWRSHADEPR